MLLGHINRYIGKLDVATTHYQNASKSAHNMKDNISDCTVLAFIYQQLCIYGSGSNSVPLENLTPLLKYSSLGITAQIVLHQALGNIYRSAADWHNSKSHFKTAIQLAKSSGHESRAMECRAELGRAYRSSGCHSKALKRQKKLLEFARTRGDTSNVANACGYIGFTYYSMGKDFYDEAVKYLYCKLEFCKSELNDPAGYRWCLNNIGKVYLGLKKYDLSMSLFGESRDIAKQLGNMLGLGTAYGNLGSACRAIGKHSEAIKYHKLYLEIAEKNFDTGGIAIMQRELILDHLYLFRDESVMKKKASFLAEARNYAFRALKTCLEVRSRLGKEDDILKIGNFEHNQSKIYSLLLFIVVQQGEYEAGLVLSELGRGHALADRIREKFSVNTNFLADVIDIIGSEDQIISSALSAVLDKIGKLLNDQKSHMLVYTVLENPLLKETLLYIWHVQRVLTFNGNSFQLQVHFKQSVIDEDCISSLLRDVHCSQPVIEPNHHQVGTKVHNSSTAMPLSRDIVRRKNPTQVSQQPKMRDKLEELYDLLISPMSEYIYNSSPQGSKLIIIPHGALFGVPFCALKTHGNFLIENFSICLLPSLYIMNIGLQIEEEWRKLPSSREDTRILAVGNPKMPLSDIDQLPGAEKEVKSINCMKKSTKLLCGENATKRAVISGFSEYSVIHLATHAIIHASLSDYVAAEMDTELDVYGIGDYTAKGAVILAKSDPHCSGVLTSLEIEKLNLCPSCELVVLSCCNTARGKITGDGILGLPRSLMCAGVMNMLVTLWPVHDKSTALLMEEFYRHYTVHRDAPAALQVSMLNLIRQQYQVEYWAAFCCIGTRFDTQ